MTRSVRLAMTVGLSFIAQDVFLAMKNSIPHPVVVSVLLLLFQLV